MHIITAARSVSEHWDDAPSLFSITLVEKEIQRINTLHDLIKDEDDVNSIELRIYGQVWDKAYDLGDIVETEDPCSSYFNDEQCDLIYDDKPLEAIEASGGIVALQDMLANKDITQRVECQTVTIYAHGNVVFEAYPKHCGDDMKLMSNSIDIENLKLGEILLDGV